MNERDVRVGMRVEVVEYCKRGCCIDAHYTGEVVAPAKLHSGERQEGCWDVRSDSGHLWQHVCYIDMSACRPREGER